MLMLPNVELRKSASYGQRENDGAPSDADAAARQRDVTRVK